MARGSPVLGLLCLGLLGGWLTASSAAAQTAHQSNADSGSADLPASADDSSAPLSDDAPRYTVQFIGIDDAALLGRIQQLSSLWSNRKDRADSLAQIRRRISQDLDTITQVFQAEGYFAVQASAQTAAQNDNGEEKIVVTITIDPGPRYKFESVELIAPEANLPMLREILQLTPDTPAITQAILDGEQRLRIELPRRGYPFPDIGERRMVVDHNTRTVRYSLPVDPGPKARFGAIEITGTPTLTPAHIRQLARFKPGDPFDQRKLDDFREAILETGLFSEATVEPYRESSDNSDAEEITAPIRVKVEPAKSRTIGVSFGYGTGSGAKGEVTWQHRNLLGQEERLTLLGRIGTQEQQARADLQRFNFRRRDQSLLARTVIAHEDPDAYESYRFEVGGGLERETGPKWHRRWVYSARVDAEVSRIRDALGERTYLLLSAPIAARFDGSDDLFDPTRGLRVSGLISPELSEQAGVFSYVRSDFGISYYLPFSQDGRWVLASRGRVGLIWGADRDRIAATRRFFAGGGGSIRGFGYQEVGPRDQQGQPLGGKSLVETSVELRWRLNDKFGIVPFIDGGSVHADATPSLADYRWGAGIGLRYFTDFAPIRLDIATPLDREPGERKLLFYVSIGQSF